MSKSSPAPPDYTGAAQAQGQSSLENTELQTVANRPDVSTPFGTTSWSETPTYDPVTNTEVGQWSQNTTLDPQSQAAIESQLNILQGKSGLAENDISQVQDSLGNPINYSGVSPLATTPNQPGVTGSINTGNLSPINQNPQDYNKQAIDASWGEFENQMEPQFTLQSQQLDTQLQNQGLKPGDQAYDSAMKQLELNQNNARTNASLGATSQGLSEASTLQGMNLASEGQQFNQNQAEAGFENTAAAQQANENLAYAGYTDQLSQEQLSQLEQEREMPLNEMNAILNGTQVQMPNGGAMGSAGAAQPTNYLSAANSSYGAALDAANASNQQTAGEVGGAADLAALYYLAFM